MIQNVPTSAERQPDPIDVRIDKRSMAVARLFLAVRLSLGARNDPTALAVALSSLRSGGII